VATPVTHVRPYRRLELARACVLDEPLSEACKIEIIDLLANTP
jgi:hypothetical protein